MSRPTAISPEEQEQIARRIGVLVLQGAPEDWQQITVEYRATGEYHDVLGETARQDGSTQTWEPSEELRAIFEHLREGMYRPDVGTWISALYIVERPSSYRIDINFDAEPQWQQPLPRAAYVDELRRYPRSEENIPDWMREKLGAATAPSDSLPVEPRPTDSQPPEPLGAPEPAVDDGIAPNGESDADERHFRTARIFDDTDEQGHPLVVTRTPVPPEEHAALRQYLENAPIVVASRDNEPDQLAADASAVVPATWHTDGTWLWPGAVAYYFAQYGVPPDPDLVEHVRARRFTLTTIDDQTRDAAVSVLFDHPASEDHLEVRESAPDESLPDANDTRDAPFTEAGAEPSGGGESNGATALDDVPSTDVDVLGDDRANTAPEDVDDEPDDLDTDVRDDGAAQVTPPAPAPETPAGSRHGRTDEDDSPEPEAVFHQLHDKLGAHAVDTDSYRVGSRAREAWCLVAEGQDWVVAGPEGSSGELRFTRPDQAAAYLLGNLLLSAESPEAADVDEHSQEPAEEAVRQEAPASSELPPRPPAEPEPPRKPAEQSGGHPLFTAHQDPAEDPETPARTGTESGPAPGYPSPVEEPTRTQSAPQQGPPVPPTAPPSPPVGQPAQGPRPGEPTPGPGGQGPPPLPKRQPRSEQSGSPQPGAAPPPEQSPPRPPNGQPPGPTGPNGVGMAGPPRQGAGHPPAPNGVPQRPPQGGQGEPPRPHGAPGAPPAQPPQPPQPNQAPVGQGPEQPIQPMRGEPPLTLYRDRRTVVLQPGTDLDRFGEPNGNVTYAIRTPYTQRSLPPQWASRSYLAYRVQRPVQVLRGTAVPWFEQAGGGTAYVLPGTVSDLIADGTLIALSGADAPPRPPME